MWSGPVSVHNSLLVEIHIEANIHLQLFQDPENPDRVKGWVYFTEGEVEFSGFPSYPCLSREVSGELVPTEQGIEIDCLTVEDGQDVCIEVIADENGASFIASYWGFSAGDYLTNYEGLAERDSEVFSCLR